MKRFCSPHSNVMPAYVQLLALCMLLPQMVLAQDDDSLDDYRLASGDVIDVRVYGEEDLSMELTVAGNGSVDYAFVGEFIISGKTVAAVQQEIYQRLLGDFLLEPKVSVTVVRFRDFLIYGEVVRPGAYPWQPGLSVRKAITLAGGLRERASDSKWYLISEGANEDQRRKVTADDLLQPGDTLTIEQSFF
jgi:polysaccharide export outer membrane protein